MLYVVIIASKYKTRVYDIKAIHILRLFADYRDVTVGYVTRYLIYFSLIKIPA